MTNLTPGPDLDRRVAEAVGITDDDTNDIWVEPNGSPWIMQDGIECQWEPSTSNEDALAAIEATGQEFIITSIVGDPGHRAYIVRIEDINMDEPFVSPRVSTLPLAICAAILAWKEGQR